MKTTFISLVAVLSICELGAGRRVDATTPFTSHYENVLGTSLDLRVAAGSSQAAQIAEDVVLRQIAHDAAILSSYDPSSEFSRWFATHGEAVRVSPELFDVLALFDAWRNRTGGALDPAAESVLRVWRAAESRNQLPAEAALAAAVRDVRQQHWTLDPVAHTATHLSTTPLVLNTFVKGYIIDRAARAALAGAPIQGVVVNVGGDIVTRGAWTERIGITDPRDNADNAAPLATLAVADRAVATSGDYRRGFDIGGQHYSHIVDPRTGRPTTHVLSATVVAPDGVNAGALATTLCVMTPEQGELVAASVPATEFMMVLADGGRVESAGWRKLASLEPAPRATAPARIAGVPAAQLWASPWELTVSIELARPSGMAKRPYVAIWIEDKDKFPVRTIALLFDKTRYLPELRAWYRGDRLRAMADGTDITTSVSSATRSPGQYTFKWDGKDQQGKPVKMGAYTVLIEVTREHGTYQIFHQEMDFSGTPKKLTLEPNIEVAAAALDYHKAAAR